MEPLTSERRKQLYDTIRQRFIERAKAETGNAKNWKTVKIYELPFQEYYNKALSSLEFRVDNDLSDEHDKETWLMWHGEPPSKEEQEKLREKKAKREGEKTEYSIDPQVLKMWDRPSEEKRESEIKEIADTFNENVEAQVKRAFCPRCHSSVCHCED